MSKYKKLKILGFSFTIIAVISMIPSVLAYPIPPGDELGYLYGAATHRADWYPGDPNVYVEVTLKVQVRLYPGYKSIYYSMTYKIGTVWCVSNIHAVETSLKYNTPSSGVTTATVHRRFAYWFIIFPVVVDIKCQVHFDENTGLFYFSEIVRDNGAAIAQALMENFPWDSLYNG
ncbi:MAG: hypothetical protein ACFFDG_05345 [Promethearchaeota archaeon]